MDILTYPLRYLTLKDEADHYLLFRNLLAVVVITAVLSLPFVAANANYFGEKGFLDRFGSFCGILTGFYIAALVGIASFASSIGDLDKEIEVGRITVKDTNGNKIGLTRRQYVSAMFGYLSFVSLALSVVSIIFVVVSEGAKTYIDIRLGYIAIVIFNLFVAHMIVTTFHGLYYFIDRLYDKEPVPSRKPNRKS